MPIDILIVDDDQVLANMLKDAMAGSNSGLKSEVIIPDGDRDVFEDLRRKAPRLAVLDINMPGIDGISLCRKIKSDSSLAGTKVVIYTAKGFEQDRVKALNFGADEFIDKSESIVSVVKKVMALFAGTVEVKFWGVRGSLPTPGPKSVKYGGNTSCVTVRSGGEIFIFDAGTGIREFGGAFLKESKKMPLYLCISHFHWDHIQGLPFFMPAYQAGQEIHIYGCEEADTPLSRIISNQMNNIHFPVPLKHLGASLEFHPIQEGRYAVGKTNISAIYLNHPGSTLGYKIESEGKSIIYISDNELAYAPKSSYVPDMKILEFCKGADLLIHDGQYTEEEYFRKKGWGHSSFNAALQLAIASKVKSCVIFHHEPEHSDDDLDKIEEWCKTFIQKQGASFGCQLAREGSAISL